MPSERTGRDRQEIKYGLPGLAEKFLLQLQAAGRSSNTLYQYRRIFTDFERHVLIQCGCNDIRLIKKQQIADYADQLMGYRFGLHQKSVWLLRLKIFLRWVVEQGLILADPTRWITTPAIKKRKHPPYLSQEEMAKLLDSIATDNEKGIRDRAMFELLYSSGLRSAEVRRLTVSDINFADRIVRVLNAKGKKDRIVPVGRFALHFLDRYIALRGLNLAGPLFYNLYSGKPMDAAYVRDALRKRANKAHIKKKCHPGIFRHSFAIHMLENSASIRHIQEMLGHVYLKTTEIYTKVIPSELKRIHQQAHPAERRRPNLPQIVPRVIKPRRVGPRRPDAKR